MPTLHQLSQLLRVHILTSTTAAQSGHATSALSAVELMATLLFGGIFRADLDHPEAPTNDRLIFSKGHAAPLLYALYAVAGKIPAAELLTLRQFGSRLEGHPTHFFPYTEAATGSLGQGLSVGVGMALAAKLDGLPYRTYVLLGDSEMAEGQVWEAVQLAAAYKLDNLVGVIDVNRLGQRGQTMYGHATDKFARMLQAFGWNTVEVDGHNVEEVARAYQRALHPGAVTSHPRPTMIVARTLKGKGVLICEDQDQWHSKPLTEAQLSSALADIGEVDPQWRGVVLPPLAAPPRSQWQFQSTPTFQSTSTSQSPPVSRATGHALPQTAPLTFTDELVPVKKAIGQTLVKLGATVPELVVLDAEVSNSTHTDLFQARYPERFLEMFIAEQNMVSTAVGLARRGKIPVVSTFAAFLTRAFDQLRMAEYSRARMVVSGSYAGVSIGKDGISQMGLEDLAMMRSLRTSTVLYPSDAVSASALMSAAVHQPGITYIRGTREPTPIIYAPAEQFAIGGSKVLRSSEADVVTVVAAGITVHEALRAHQQLLATDIFVRVIDLYSIKPVDAPTLLAAAQQTRTIITVEDHYQAGGLGEVVAAVLTGNETPVYSLFVNKEPKSGLPPELLSYEEIDAAAIIAKVKMLIHS